MAAGTGSLDVIKHLHDIGLSFYMKDSVSVSIAVLKLILFAKICLI